MAEAASGVALTERLATEGRNEIGFVASSEARRGEAAGGGTVAGPLPASLQNFTAYEAIVLSKSNQPAVARQFVAALGTSAAKQLLVQNGWDVQDVAAQAKP